MTPTERLRTALKLLKPAVRTARRQGFGAIAITVPGSEDANPFAARLEQVLRLIADAADELSGEEWRAKTYDTEALPTLTTDFRGWNPPKKEPDHG